MTERSRIVVNDDNNAWSERAARVSARLRSDRHVKFFRIVSGVHAFSAFTIIAANIGVFSGAGSIQWPWWYSCMLVVASILPIISGASAWFSKAPPTYLFFLASASVVLPLLYAGYYRSPVVWANIIVICALAIFLLRQRKSGRAT